MGIIRRFSAIGLTSLVLGACASIPPATVRYFHPRAELEATVTRTVACDARETPYIANIVRPKVAYSADYEAGPVPVDVGSFSGTFANTDATFTLTEDGRLAGLNTTATGQGSEIIKAAVELAALVLPGASGGNENHEACEYIKANGDKGVMTLTFAAVQRAFGDQTVELRPITEDVARYRIIRRLLGNVCMTTTQVPNSGVARIERTGARRDDILLHLRQTKAIRLSFYQTEAACGPGLPDTARIWDGRFIVPVPGQETIFPIPRAALFGGNTSVVTLADSGAITSIRYARTSGAAAALGGASQLVSRADGDTAAEEAAEADAQADRIAQQQRLVRCRADPTTCPT